MSLFDSYFNSNIIFYKNQILKVYCINLLTGTVYAKLLPKKQTHLEKSSVSTPEITVIPLILVNTHMNWCQKILQSSSTIVRLRKLQCSGWISSSPFLTISSRFHILALDGWSRYDVFRVEVPTSRRKLNRGRYFSGFSNWYQQNWHPPLHQSYAINRDSQQVYDPPRT